MQKQPRFAYCTMYGNSMSPRLNVALDYCPRQFYLCTSRLLLQLGLSAVSRFTDKYLTFCCNFLGAFIEY